MTRLQEALLRLEADLRALGVRWALVGGMAVSFRARPRVTLDVDVAIPITAEADQDNLVRELRGRGYQGPFTLPRNQPVRFVRLLAPNRRTEGVFVDLLFELSGVERDVVELAQNGSVFPDLRVPIATTGHLLALKVLANREKDQDDIRALLESARREDIELARRALDLMSKRDFERLENRDLLREFARFLASMP